MNTTPDATNSPPRPAAGSTPAIRAMGRVAKAPRAWPGPGKKLAKSCRHAARAAIRPVLTTR